MKCDYDFNSNTRQLLKRFREGRFAERPGQGDTKLFVLSIGTSDS